MILRPRQRTFVDNCLKALTNHSNTLGVAPTGAGKTIIAAGLLKELLSGNQAKAAFLAHRDELTAQNCMKFIKVAPNLSTSIFDSNSKSWRGRVTFGMVPTLARNLNTIPTLDVLGIDEAHHVYASIYQRVIDKVREVNPNVKIFGLTATPNRGDKKGLRGTFSNCADQITIAELIKAGNLVPPRTYVINVGASEELSKVRKMASDYDMTEVEALMNTSVINNAVVQKWKEKAGDRKTMVFCSTVHHADDVTSAFTAAGVEAVMVHGELSDGERRATLRRYEKGSAQVIVNVAVLTEGYDFPPISCVILLRPSSHKSTMMQMIGRGLRTVDPELFPGVVKTDCVVLDFGTAVLTHGTLETDVNLDSQEPGGDAPTKECPECNAWVPISVMECPLCGYVFPPPEEKEDIVLSNFVMSEIDILNKSNFRWVDLFYDDTSLMASGFEAWGGIFYLNGRWHSVGGKKASKTRLLAVGERMVCLAAADDWLSEHETADSAHKSCRWLTQGPTEKQLPYLPDSMKINSNRYQASCFMSFKFNKDAIKRIVFKAQQEMSA